MKPRRLFSRSGKGFDSRRLDDCEKGALAPFFLAVNPWAKAQSVGRKRRFDIARRQRRVKVPLKHGRTEPTWTRIDPEHRLASNHRSPRPH